jgi:hypothetical protein
MSRVLNLILTHQPPEAVARLLAWWRAVADADDVLLAYGGQRQDFEGIPHPRKVFIDDPGLRTRDHQRDLQDISAVIHAGAEWLRRPENTGFTHVFSVEFDHLPVVRDLHSRLIARLQSEQAGVLAHWVERVDRTGHRHYLYHKSKPEILAYWRSLSVRADREVVLSMMGTGSFWTRAAFLDLASHLGSVRAYFELHLPTVAHHLGYRVRNLPEQNAWVKNLPDPEINVAAAMAGGAWTVHPIKETPAVTPW